MTYGHGLATTRGTTIDLVFVNDALDDLLQACMVNEEDLTNHHSDHQALITLFTSLKTDLNLVWGPRSPTWDKNWTKELQGAVVQALNKHSPNQAPAGQHKAWWKPDLHKPLRKMANRAKKVLKNSPTEVN
ncbi:hypothetical protein CROQUDRAFT_102241 [Cronartium quercuum f. sp. fusiforme G11]|uniref:Uncharacterized protein n=1 Tax=Cronartium quercuum f. sp. fusiforme G11 TaxID=708437 RepID=A0A9P6T4V1_9BASI|nr:hypothetical protein CROQUDRAFT_102241 [Cronartium quercuum f. sp. fusiforme G11]